MCDKCMDGLRQRNELNAVQLPLLTEAVHTLALHVCHSTSAKQKNSRKKINKKGDRGNPPQFARKFLMLL